MRLRELRAEDAPLMLEWMHDPSVVGHMKARFGEKTLEDCRRFIADARTGGNDVHLAVADDATDEYLGTVSLKHIDGGAAEFAITMRKCAMGTGASRDGMRAVLEHGFERMGLSRIYWCVSPENARAVRFYDKNGYPRVDVPTEARGYTEAEKRGYIWYAVAAAH